MTATQVTAGACMYNVSFVLSLEFCFIGSVSLSHLKCLCPVGRTVAVAVTRTSQQVTGRRWSVCGRRGQEVDLVSSHQLLLPKNKNHIKML